MPDSDAAYRAPKPPRPKRVPRGEPWPYQDRQLPTSGREVLEAAGFGVEYSRWLNDRDPAGFLFTVQGDVVAAQQLLDRALGAGRVVVESARYSHVELLELRDRVSDDAEGLRGVGIELMSWGPSRDCVTVQYFAADRGTAEATLADRYGEMLEATWQGPSSQGPAPQTFGSWICDGTILSVFYPLPLNGERPGSCVAAEFPDRVEVTLTIITSLGAKTLIGGYHPSVATVELAAPVGERDVVDMADGASRPRWAG